VHSNEQMRASVPEGSRSLSQHSQLGRISSMAACYCTQGGPQAAHRTKRPPMRPGQTKRRDPQDRAAAAFTGCEEQRCPARAPVRLPWAHLDQRNSQPLPHLWGRGRGGGCSFERGAKSIVHAVRHPHPCAPRKAWEGNELVAG
jgi:hypothetical protein